MIIPAGTAFTWRGVLVEVETDPNERGQQDYRWKRHVEHEWLYSMTLSPVEMPQWYSEREATVGIASADAEAGEVVALMPKFTGEGS